jgi:hypothetical protein
LRARALKILLSKKKKIVPILVFFGSQEAVKKFGPKIGFFLVWTFHPSGIPTVKTTKKHQTTKGRWGGLGRGKK